MFFELTTEFGAGKESTPVETDASTDMQRTWNVTGYVTLGKALYHCSFANFWLSQKSQRAPLTTVEKFNSAPRLFISPNDRAEAQSQK